MSTLDLAVIGNGRYGALLDCRGRFVWCCMDAFDGDPIFNSLVNDNSDQSGYFDVVLEGFQKAEQHYLGPSAVLVTILHSSQGDSVEIRDFAPRFFNHDRMFRPLLHFRIIRRLRGDPRIAVRIRPTFRYNSTDGYQTRGSQHIRFCGPTHKLRVTTNTSIRYILDEVGFVLPAEPIYIVFGEDESFANSLTHVARDFEAQTIAHWKHWCKSLHLPIEYQEILVRAAMALTIVQSEDSGGLLSALTTSLPLGPSGGATRDARVCSLLDECLALPVLCDIGLFDMCNKFLVFLKGVCFEDDAPSHMYAPQGGPVSKVREGAPFLAGYRGVGGVHYGVLPPGGQLAKKIADGEEVGENKNSDLWDAQTAVYGLLVVSLAHAFFDIRLTEDLCTPKLFEKLELYGRRVYDNFMKAVNHEPDPSASQRPVPSSANHATAGVCFYDDDPQLLLWHMRDPKAGQHRKSAEDGPLVHTLTSVLCWAAVDRLQRIATHFASDAAKAEYWRQRAVKMHSTICRRAWNGTRCSFTTFWEGSRAGPSVLRLAELGFVSAEDPRFRGTLRAFEADAFEHAVSQSDMNQRMEKSVLDTGQAVGDLKRPSACFRTNTLLWYCEALRSTGALQNSKRLLEAIVRCSTHQGLVPEAVDMRSAELWGNVPCTSAMLSLLRVAPRLSRAWREL